jgi:hypothetical protein
MLWIKRNLFLAIGGLIALLLLGFGIFLLLGAKSRSEALESEIAEMSSLLNNLYNSPVFPGQTNVAIARREAEKLRTAVDQLRKLFEPVKAEKVTGLAFRSYRDNTLAELHRMAEQARTTLPGKGYAFSFETQRTKVDFKDGTFPAIPEQMAEVRAICKILFDAHVDPLVNIRRAKVSKDDDESNAASDYLFMKVETNAATGTVQSPYELVFDCLTSDLTAVLQGFLGSRHGFVVKGIHVEPAVEPAAANPQNPEGRRPGQPRPPPNYFQRPGAADKPIVLLRERRLKVTLLVYAIRTTG